MPGFWSWLVERIDAVPAEERSGATLVGPYWEAPHWDPPRRLGLDPGAFVRGLGALFPDGDSVLVLEGGEHPVGVRSILLEHAVPPRLKVERGTVWPRQDVFHVPVTRPIMDELGRRAEENGPSDLCLHLHVYQGDAVVLQWYDAFRHPFFVSKAVPLDRAAPFCEGVGTYLLEPDSDPHRREPRRRRQGRFT